MNAFIISCVRMSARTAAGHSHIVGVGVGGTEWTVEQVYTAIDNGDRFYTASPSGSNVVPVAKYHCCGIDTLRSHADGQWNNNLDALPECP